MSPQCPENILSQPLKQRLLPLSCFHHHVPGQERPPHLPNYSQKSHSWLQLWGLRPTSVEGARVARSHTGQVGNSVTLCPSARAITQSTKLSPHPVTWALQRHPVVAPLDQPLVLLFPIKISKPMIQISWMALTPPPSPTSKPKSSQ